MTNCNQTIFSFNVNSDITSWRTIDDIVMGGKSNGNFKINKDGKGEFYGSVSLENNGGFSSLRHRFSALKVTKFKEAILRIKGDGKNYQFRIKDSLNNKHSFISHFKTNGEWQTIRIPLSEMYPAFRGRKLTIRNFSSETIEEIAFLIGNKITEDFKLQIATISIK